MGTSGRAAAQALRGKGASVIEVDDSDAHLPAAGPPAPEPGRRSGRHLGGGTATWPAAFVDDLAGAVDLVVASPGWAPSREPLASAIGLVPVWSEVELAWRLRARTDAPWFCVTGTNGKTTVVEMAAAILRAAGWDAVAAGNIGLPLAEAAANPATKAFVCELSSFQLHFTYSLTPACSALLNIAPDHLDWHGGIDAYAKDKARVANGAQQAVIVGPDAGLAEVLDKWSHPGEEARRVRFTSNAPGPGEIGVIDGAIVDRAWPVGNAFDAPGEGFAVASLADLAHLDPFGKNGTPTVARHVVLDALAAVALTRAAGIDPAAIGEGLRGFALGEHRFATVAAVEGVTYIDDSKATNPHAVEAAFAGLGPGSVVWIAGGLVKGASLDALVGAIAGQLRAAVLIGRDRRPFADALRRHAAGLPVVEIDDRETGGVMREAVAAARTLAAGRGTVLLAPAAASMDQFVSYAQRGEAFARAVAEFGRAAPAGPPGAGRPNRHLGTGAGEEG
jgi:UDP-N-acetylmuramoylalanine--D-glutamate ligase